MIGWDKYINFVVTANDCRDLGKSI